MSSYRDPPRLRDMGAELPEGLAAALASDSSEFPPASEVSELANRLGPLMETATIAAAAAIPASLMAPKAPLSLAGALKVFALKWGNTVILPMAIGAASGAVAWEAREYVASRESSPSTLSQEAPAAKTALAARGNVLQRESNAPTRGEEPVDPSVVTAEIERVAPPARAPSPVVPSRVPPPSAPSAAEVAAPVAPAENATEIELIDRAQRALAQQPAVARQWIDEHARRFPEGTFAQEREAIAIEALVGEGRLLEARSRAAQFRTKFPQSAYLRRIEAVLRNPKGQPPY